MLEIVRKVLQSFFPSLPHSQNVKTLFSRVTGWLCDPPPPPHHHDDFWHAVGEVDCGGVGGGDDGDVD